MPHYICNRTKIGHRCPNQTDRGIFVTGKCHSYITQLLQDQPFSAAVQLSRETRVQTEPFLSPANATVELQYIIHKHDQLVALI